MAVQFAWKYLATKAAAVVALEAATAAEDAEAEVEIETEKEVLSEATDVVLVASVVESAPEDVSLLLLALDINHYDLSLFKSRVF